MTRKLLLVAILLAVLALVAACGQQPEAETTEPQVTEEVVATEEEPEATAEVTAEPTAEIAPDVPISEVEEVHITTSGMHMVGVGDWVAAERYGIAAGEDPAAQPAQAIIMPYAIYPNMLVATPDDFEAPDALEGTEDMTFEWTLEAPDGSAAELVASDTVALFQADAEGEYVLSLVVTDAAGNASEPATWTIHTSTYVGVGGISGDASAPQCATCHGDQAEAWAETGHASLFTNGINGVASDHYGPNCISCHTTGFNNREGADSGGFDDVAAAEGWAFPGVLQEGNWEAMIENFPATAGLANIQCESCHGPGADHNGNVEMINMGLEYATCAQCHAEEPYHVKPIQWELSPHAQKTARAFWYPIGENRAACVGCHTGGGYIDAANGVPVEERRTDYQVITCAVCHDPHSTTGEDFQLRVFDAVTLPNGVEVTDAGPAATCMTCHNTRNDPVAAVEAEPTEIKQGDVGTGKFRIPTPHYSSAAELLTGGNAGYTWGLELPNSPHGEIVENTCITCHMAESPGMDDKGTEDRADDEPLPGHNTVGDHTFLITSPVDGTINTAACADCHGEIESLDFEAKEDYDGDGAVETNKEELVGLLELLKPVLETKGVVFLESHPYYNVPQTADNNIKGAVYNYHLVMEAEHRGSESHNYQYLVALLQLSYRMVAGSDVPNATIVAPTE